MIQSAQRDLRGEGLHSRAASTYRRPDGIVQIVFRDGIDIREEEARDARTSIEWLIGDLGGVLVMADVRAARSLAPAARRVASDPRLSKLAVVVASPVTRWTGNAYLELRPLARPTRLFTSEDEALRWLRGEVPRPSR